MRFWFVLLLSCAIGFHNYSQALTLQEPITTGLKKNVNVSSIEGSRCLLYYKDNVNLTRQAIHILYNLESLIFAKLPNKKSAYGLNHLITQDCLGNGELKDLSGTVVNNVQNCLNENYHPEIADEEKIKEAIHGSICSEIRRMIRWEIKKERKKSRRNRRQKKSCPYE